MTRIALNLAALLVAGTAWAAAPKLKPGLSGLGFLLGHWSTPTRGQVADTGGTSAGTTSFVPEAGGAVVLRQDHVDLYDRAGKHSGDFEIIMMIYTESGHVRADYADGDHIIHYTNATIVPGQAVTFTSAENPAAPRYKLAYTLRAPNTLDIAFSVQPPGSPDFRPIATGSAIRDR